MFHLIWVGDVKLLVDGIPLQVQYSTDQPDTPLVMRFPSSYAYPVLKTQDIVGQAAKGVAYKPAFIGIKEAGEQEWMRIMVPEFVKPGDRILVDTQDVKYLGRATDT